MRVLHVSSGNLYGGVETVLVTLARARHFCPAMEPHFALSFEGRLSEELVAAGVPVHYLGNVRSSRPWTVWRARQRLRELLEHRRFDAVICHMSWPMAIFGPAVSTSRSLLVYWAHGLATGKHWLERWAGRVRPDLAIANSHFTAQSLPRLYPGVETAVMYTPVLRRNAVPSAAERREIRAQLGAGDESVAIVQVSRLEAWKGHRLHLQALALLKDIPEWVCWVVGGPQRKQECAYLEELQALSWRLGISGRVRFLGQRTDVLHLLAAGDIFCQPNLAPEPFGISFIEAMGAGLPVIATAIGAALELIDESCGMLARPDDPAALAACLQALIGDPARRQQLGSGGPRRAETLCDPARQTAYLHEVLERALARKPEGVAERMTA